jgi:hypothetical protein
VEQQVEAAVRAYIAGANQAFESGDVAAMLTVTEPNCPCRGLVRSIRRVYRSGGKYEGTRYNLVSIKIHDVFGESASAEVRAKVPPYRVIRANGAVSEDSSGGQLHTDFALIRREGTWRLSNSFDLG